jgi:hypothetical protein
MACKATTLHFTHTKPYVHYVIKVMYFTVPSAPPLEIKCEPRSAQGVALSWQPPPQLFQNGRIQGYKVYYENVDEWPPGV